MTSVGARTAARSPASSAGWVRHMSIIRVATAGQCSGPSGLTAAYSSRKKAMSSLSGVIASSISGATNASAAGRKFTPISTSRRTRSGRARAVSSATTPPSRQPARWAGPPTTDSRYATVSPAMSVYVSGPPTSGVCPCARRSGRCRR
ncbi:hypothetical protein SALBM217S_06729 [Streptomyces griseoloalbus]